LLALSDVQIWTYFSRFDTAASADKGSENIEKKPSKTLWDNYFDDVHGKEFDVLLYYCVSLDS
jgi:hypothetical protein